MGQDPALFWKMTLREIRTVMDGAADRLTREHNDRAWLAWHTTAIGRMKRFPELKQLTIGKASAPRRQTAEEQIHIAMQWTAALQRK